MSTSFVAEFMLGRGYDVLAGTPAPVLGGAADSRLVKPGDLFTAFRGASVDGNVFLEDAVEAGAIATISERAPTMRDGHCTYVVCADSREAVAELATAWRKTWSGRVVGITGTVGKTTAKDLVAGALSATYRTHKSPGNFNSREGLPLALFSLTSEHEVSVLEMAMDSPGEIKELCSIAKPDIGIVLNIGRTHVSKLGSVEAIAAEKLSLPRSLPKDGTAILNADDGLVASVIPELQCPVLTFGLSAEADLRAERVRGHGLDGTSFDVAFGAQVASIALSMPGTHVIAAALASIATLLAMGATLAEAANAVSQANVPGRMRVTGSSFGFTILDDRYNASPASLSGALRLLAGLRGKRIALLGEMAELGPFGETEHRAAGRLCATSCDALFAVGPLCQHLVSAAKLRGLSEARWFPNKDEAAVATASFAEPGDYVLVKASRGHAFETILPLLGATL